MNEIIKQAQTYSWLYKKNYISILSFQSQEIEESYTYNKVKKKLLKSFKKFIFDYEIFEGQEFVNYLKCFIDKIDIVTYNEYLLNCIITNLLMDLNYAKDSNLMEQIQIILVDNKIREIICEEDFPNIEIRNSKYFNKETNFRCVIELFRIKIIRKN